jgi:RimJ/RimL family protein N-acetyltransferase
MYQILRDGTYIHIRPIRPEDAERLQEGLGRLSAESIQRRFLSAKPRFSRAELRYLTEVDGHAHAAFIVELATAPHTLLGVGRWVRLAEGGDTAEAAITVADAWQAHGIGSLLTGVLASAARAEGIRRFTATMQADNRPAHRLMERLTAHLERRHDGPLDELVADLAA